MQTILLSLQARLDDFIQQRQLRGLLLETDKVGLAATVQLWKAIPKRHPSAHCVLCLHPFETAAQYVDAILEQLQIEHQGRKMRDALDAADAVDDDTIAAALQRPMESRKEMLEIIERLEALNSTLNSALEGELEPPDLEQEAADDDSELLKPPPELTPPPGPAIPRLLTALQYLRSNLPDAPPPRVVVALLPPSRQDERAYRTWLKALLEGLARPDAAGLRLLILSPQDTGLVGQQQVSSSPYSAILPLDLSPDTVRQSLEAQAADEAQPLHQRLMTSLTLALQQVHLHERPAGLLRVERVIEQAQAQGLDEVEAVARLCRGDLAREDQLWPLALEHFCRGLEVAGSCSNLTLSENMMARVASIAEVQGAWPQVRDLCIQALALNSVSRDKTLLAEHLTRLQKACEALGAPEPARDCRVALEQLAREQQAHEQQEHEKNSPRERASVVGSEKEHAHGV